MNFSVHTSIDKFRLIAMLEGWSYVILVVIAMPLKYFLATPQWIRPVGMAHGVLFVMYMLLLLLCMWQYKWSIGKGLILFLISLIPFGTFIWKRLYRA